MNRRNVALLTGLAILSVLACNLPTPHPLTPTSTGTGPPEAATQESPSRPTPPALATPQALSEIPPAPTALNVPLQVHNPFDVARADEPATSGVPLPRDLELTDPGRLRLVDAAGNPIPAQFTPLARWGGAPEDASAPIRWVLIDFQTTVGPQATAYYFLQEGGPGPMPVHSLTVTDGADVLAIDAGVAQFRISKADGGLTAPGLAAPITSRVRGTDGTERVATGPVTVRVALAGPVRVSVHVKGSYGNGLDYTLRYWFYAGQPTVRLFHTAENNTPCPLAEYEQPDCTDIGSGGSVAFADLSLVIPTDLGGGLTYQAGGVGGDLSGDILLYQDSSGTDHWDRYPTFTDWDGNPLDTRPRMQSTVSFRGYRTTLGGAIVDSGDHAAGWLSVAGEGGSWSVGVRDFWQNFPKALRAASSGVVEISLFPDEFGSTGLTAGGSADYAFTLRAGEHKTHEILLAYNSPPPVAGEGVWKGALFAQSPSAWYVASGALGPTALPNWSDWPDYEQYIAYQLGTSPEHAGFDDYAGNIFDAIASTDFYGIFDYGDWPIDYEGYEVSPLNVKYDNDAGMWLQWARSGDPRWFDLAQAADRHAADMDILHNLHTPRHWADGIAFGHSYHDETGFANPHRNYGGNHPDTAFGMKGLLLTYYLTGYEKAYESALELADCVEYRLHNDGHLCAVFPDCNGAGYALGDSGGLYENGERPAANSLAIAVAAYRATADPRYLAVADAVVDWAGATEQPYIGGPTGADLMVKPQMLNLYLCALADYLEMRGEFGLSDGTGARDSYLTYADWLRTYPRIDLDPIETGPRAAYSYEWWFDERTGLEGEDNDNGDASINNWLLLGADALAYAYHLSGDADYLDRAATLFRTGSRDPWYEGDRSMYSESKQMVNGITFGHVFLREWAEGR